MGGIKMKKKMSKGLFVVLVTVLAFASSACAENLKMLSAFAPNFIFNIGATNNFQCRPVWSMHSF